MIRPSRWAFIADTPSTSSPNRSRFLDARVFGMEFANVGHLSRVLDGGPSNVEGLVRVLPGARSAAARAESRASFGGIGPSLADTPRERRRAGRAIRRRSRRIAGELWLDWLEPRRRSKGTQPGRARQAIRAPACQRNIVKTACRIVHVRVPARPTNSMVMPLVGAKAAKSKMN